MFIALPYPSVYKLSCLVMNIILFAYILLAHLLVGLAYAESFLLVYMALGVWRWGRFGIVPVFSLSLHPFF